MKITIKILIVLVIFFGCGQTSNKGLWNDIRERVGIKNGNQTEFFSPESRAWNKAKELNTIEAYENYLKTFTKNKKNRRKARIGKTLILDKRAWVKVKQDNFKDCMDYLSSFPQGKYKRKARATIREFCILPDAQIARIGRQQKNKNQKALGNVEKFLFAGVDCLNNEGKWINHVRGRKIYNILKNCNSKQITEAMANVMIIGINHPRLLFLVIKIGVPGTEKTLNKLLLIKCGNKLMAEDYINSGSKKLYEGGRDWAEAHSHWISNNRGDGSCRVNWGKF